MMRRCKEIRGCLIKLSTELRKTPDPVGAQREFEMWHMLAHHMRWIIVAVYYFQLLYFGVCATCIIGALLLYTVRL